MGGSPWFEREVWVVNDTRKVYTGCQVRWWLSDPDGGELTAGQMEAEIKSDGLARIGLVRYALPERFALGRHTFALELRSASGALLVNNEYAFRISFEAT